MIVFVEVLSLVFSEYQIGNWSRWLTDLFGMDDDELLEDDKDENDERQDTSFKSFHLLNALSDLMMLPKDMLLSRSIRKEVEHTHSVPFIQSRVCMMNTLFNPYLHCYNFNFVGMSHIWCTIDQEGS